MKTFGWISAAVTGFVLLSACGAGCWALAVGKGVIDRQVTPDAIVGDYEWYEQQAKDIKAADGQIRDAEEAAATFKKDNGPASEWKFDQRNEYARLGANLTGLKQSRRTMVETYNARAGMISRNAWKSSSLPHHIEE